MVNYDHLPAASRFFDGKLYQNDERGPAAGRNEQADGAWIPASRPATGRLLPKHARQDHRTATATLLSVSQERETVRLRSHPRCLLRHQVLLHPNLQAILGNACHDEAAAGQDAARKSSPSNRSTASSMPAESSGSPCTSGPSTRWDCGWKKLATCKSVTSMRIGDGFTFIAAREPRIATCRCPLRHLIGFGKHWITHRHPRLLFPAEGRDHKQSSVAKTPIQTSHGPEGDEQDRRRTEVRQACQSSTPCGIPTPRICSKRACRLKVIQQYLGHSSLQTTMVYLHLTDTAEVNARETIEKTLSAQVADGRRSPMPCGSMRPAVIGTAFDRPAESDLADHALPHRCTGRRPLPLRRLWPRALGRTQLRQPPLPDLRSREDASLDREAASQVDAGASLSGHVHGSP